VTAAGARFTGQTRGAHHIAGQADAAVLKLASQSDPEHGGMDLHLFSDILPLFIVLLPFFGAGNQPSE